MNTSYKKVIKELKKLQKKEEEKTQKTKITCMCLNIFLMVVSLAFILVGAIVGNGVFILKYAFMFVITLVATIIIYKLK